MSSQSESSETQRLLDRYGHGDRSALEHLLAGHRDYIRRLVELRMDGALRRRVDPSDVIQETQIMVTNRIDDYLQRRPMSFRIWLRRETLERLVDVRRRHLAHKRDVKRELRLSDASSMSIARQLISPSPSHAAQRKELACQVRSAIERLSDNDRETILLRHIEELSHGEIAELLQLDEATVRQRHGRAIRRLMERLQAAGVSGRSEST